MILYSAYNLILESDIQLSVQRIKKQKPNVKIKLSNLDTKKQLVNNNQVQSVLGEIPGVAKFFIQDGKEILVDPEAGISDAVLSPCILGSAMAVLLQQRGYLVLHASCVVINGFAVAFLGNSGVGKSTICSAFHDRGYEILTDDVMAMRIEQNGIWVIPSLPEIKLRDDSAGLMGYKQGTLSPLHPLTQKKVHRIEAGFSTQSVPLRQIYVLSKGDRHQIQPLGVQNGFAELIRHTRAVHTLKCQNLEQAHFQKCVAVAQNIPLSRLVRKFALSELSNLINLVERDIASISSVKQSELATRSSPSTKR